MAPLLPLDTFRKILGYNPWHFWGMSSSLVPVTSACNLVVKEYAWQDANTAGRVEMREAIESAEAKLKQYLRYSVAPHYVEETLRYPPYYDRSQWRYDNYDADSRLVSVQASEGYIQAVGIEARTTISLVAAVVYTDENGDGLDDLFTVTVATTVTEPKEIAVYFKASDRLDGEAVSEKWRIQPVTVTISGGNATIKGPAWILARPILYEGVGTTDIDPTNAAIFVTQVEVYRRYTNPSGTTTATSQGKLLWEARPFPAWAFCYGCGGSDNSTDAAAYAESIARVGIRDANNGILIPGAALYNTDTATWTGTYWGGCAPPTQVTVRYYAGYPLDSATQQMESDWQRVVARFAAAELPVRICADNTGSHFLHHWQFDLARSAGVNDEQYQISPSDLDNPFGTRRGQVMAWKKVLNLRNMRGFLPG